MSGSDSTGPRRTTRSGRRRGLPSIDDDSIRDAVSRHIEESLPEDEGSEEERPSSRDDRGDPSSSNDPEPDSFSQEPATAASDVQETTDTSFPYIKITPAREQVPPKQIVKGLYGFHRAGRGSSVPLSGVIPFTRKKTTFEFLIHKPRNTQRFDFYLGVHPYDVRAFKNLANNVSTMYPDSFRFEVVSFSARDAFTQQSSRLAGLRALAELEGIEEIEGLQGFQPTQQSLEEFIDDEFDDAPEEEGTFDLPAMVRWGGTEAKNKDWMTLLSRFTELEASADTGYRSPLSVLLEQAAGTDDPFVFQAVFTPRHDWTDGAESHKRDLKMGNHGAGGAFKNELFRVLGGTSEEERQQIHRGDTPEQIGGTVQGVDPGDTTQLPRMGQIDLKQPTVTFDVSLRAAGPEQVISSISGAFNPLSGPYYGIEGSTLGRSKKAFKRLCNAALSKNGFKSTFSSTNPVLVASPDELANFVTVPNSGGLPKVSRGASGGTPDARSPLTATDETQLAKYDTGMCIGRAVTASADRPNIDIKLSAEQLTHHVLRAASTGAGKSTAMINDALSAYDELDGPIFIFDKKGGSMFDEYKRAHFRQFGDLDDVVHFTVPGGNGEVPAFPFFDIRPQVAAGMSREAAVQEKMDRYVELLSYVIGAEMNENAFVANEILVNLIKALFDPVHGEDAFGISTLRDAAIEMQGKTDEPSNGTYEEKKDTRKIPDVSDDGLEKSLKRHFNADRRRFDTSIDAVLNRITKLQERDFIWRMMNFVPEWDDERGEYAEDQMFFNLDDILESNRVILIDTGELRPASSNLFTVLMLDYLWSWVRLRKRIDHDLPSPSDGYVVNLIIDEAAPIMQAALLRDEMIPDAREFALAFEMILHFPEQVKRDALDTSAYKEILRNINTKLIGKGANDDELATTLFHEELEPEQLADRIASLPRGEWIAQLPDTGFRTDTPELVSMEPLDIPDGHSDSESPVTGSSQSPGSRLTFAEMDQQQQAFTRHRYSLIPSINSPATAVQRAAQFSSGLSGGTAVEHDGRRTDTESSSLSLRVQKDTEQDSAAVDDRLDTTLPSRSRRSNGGRQSPRDERASPGGWTNEYGTTLGTGTPQPPSPDQGTANQSDGGEKYLSETDRTESFPGDLTGDEVQFIRNIIRALNGELEGYELTESMTTIRNLSGSDIDEEKLIEKDYLEEHWANQKYYWVTEKGQKAVNRSLYSGRNKGDLHEKTIHKVFSEYFGQYLRHEMGLHVEKYYKPPAGGMVFDVAGFTVEGEGWEDLAVIGEVLTSVKDERVLKHYEDFREFGDVQKYWVVQNYEVAHDLIRALDSEGYINEVPSKDITDYKQITRRAFDPESSWTIVGANEIVELVKQFRTENGDV